MKVKYILKMIFVVFITTIITTNVSAFDVIREHLELNQKPTIDANEPEFPFQIIPQNKHLEFVNQAYLNCSEYATVSYQEIYSEWMNRVVIHHVPLSEYPECPMLSSVLRKNKCNNNYSYQFTTIDDFNPLMYHFPFETKETRYFRIDGKPFIIEIKAKSN
jgi:hypothetical protein